MNTHFINLQTWLAEHSVTSERNGREIIFTHIGGTTSVLLLREEQERSAIQIGLEPLSSFYHQYSGASIGTTQILIGTNKAGGADISHGIRIPDLNQMTKRSRELEFTIGKDEQVFMSDAAWLFVYTIAGEGGRTVLREYDRDFGTSRVMQDLDEVLETWWKIVQGDL